MYWNVCRRAQQPDRLAVAILGLLPSAKHAVVVGRLAAYTCRYRMCCLPLGEKTADIAGMGVRRKWTSATDSGERPVGLAGRGYPARSWCLREGRRTCACDVFDKSPFGLFDRLCMVRQDAGPSGLIDQAGLHSGYMASRKQKAQS